MFKNFIKLVIFLGLSSPLYALDSLYDNNSKEKVTKQELDVDDSQEMSPIPEDISLSLYLPEPKSTTPLDDTNELKDNPKAGLISGMDLFDLSEVEPELFDSNLSSALNDSCKSVVYPSILNYLQIRANTPKNCATTEDELQSVIKKVKRMQIVSKSSADRRAHRFNPYSKQNML